MTPPTCYAELAQEHDLVGEGLVGKHHNNLSNSASGRSITSSLPQLRNAHQTAYDPSVNVVKTHFPERKGWKHLRAQRVFLLVRNPYDAIDSYWNLCCTNTHTRSLDESVYEQYAAKFESLARHEIKIWCEFHNYWYDICEREGVPLLVVRYEDLVLNPESEMQRVLRFLMEDCEELNDFWQWRIRHAIGKTTKMNANSSCTTNLGSYRPRSSNGGLTSIGKSLRKNRYSESVLLHMHDIAVSFELERKHNSIRTKKATPTTLLQRFGYDIYDQKFPENFIDPPLVALTHSVSKHGSQHGTIHINKSAEIRSKEDPFGRAMTNWRRGQTNGDKTPFPTVSR